ncbi:TPA: hypothetical protein QCZ17_003804, partial [Bacillus cereus]|nr:hypothetical protein [Bacillus cereus]
MGKGRSNNAGKKQPNFDDSSNFAKQSQPTEKKKWSSPCQVDSNKKSIMPRPFPDIL